MVAARLLHFLSLLVLFGTALFPYYASVLDGVSAARIRRVKITASLIALVSALAWLALTAANITGSAGDIAKVALNTQFGLLWTVRFAILALIAIPISVLGGGKTAGMELGVAALLLASLAGTGHAQIGEPAWLHVTADAIHLLAAGAWLGGLVPLALVVRNQTETAHVLLRFSSMGVVAVAILVGSGVINSAFLVSEISALVTSDYGRLLLVKLVLVVLMLLLAALNRFVFLPRIQAGGTRQSILRSIAAEQTLGVLVIVIVAMLGTTEPA